MKSFLIDKGDKKGEHTSKSIKKALKKAKDPVLEKWHKYKNSPAYEKDKKSVY